MYTVVFRHLTQLIPFIAWAIVLRDVFLALDTKALLAPSVLHDRAFAQLWLMWSLYFLHRSMVYPLITKSGPEIFENDKETMVPALVASAYGTVLELGPGTGSQLSRMDQSKVTKVYGIEPVTALHDSLRTKIKETRMDDIYTIVPCGVENTTELERYGIEPGSIDTILSVQVLCSVADPDAVLKQLYKLLKPGGQIVVYEHIRNDDFLSRMMQRMSSFSPAILALTCSSDFYTVTGAWPFIMGNCCLNRPTQQYLLRAGDWAQNELQTDQREKSSSLFPRVTGTLTK